MRTNYSSILTILFLLTIGCTNEVHSPEEQSPKTSNKTPTNSSKNARVIPEGFELQWNGDGRWYGSLAGAVVWFWGPTPTELQNGIQGEWPVACQPNGPCLNDGYIATGDGSFFTVSAPACMDVVSTTIDMPSMSALYLLTNYQVVPGSVTWGTITRTIKTFSGESCSLTAYGKIIVNEQCKPTIVDYTSTSVSLCGYSDIPFLEE